MIRNNTKYEYEKIIELAEVREDTRICHLHLHLLHFQAEIGVVWAAGAHLWDFWNLRILVVGREKKRREKRVYLVVVSLRDYVFNFLVDGGDLEDRVSVLHLEPDGAVHGPCRGDVLVELDVLQLLEGGTGQVLEEGVLHAAFRGSRLAPCRGGSLAGLAGGVFLTVAKDEASPVSGVKSDLDGLCGVGFTGEDVGSFKEGFTGGIGADFTFTFGPFKDGHQEVGVDRLHDDPGVGFHVRMEGDIEDSHAPGSGIGFSIIEGVFEEINFVVLLVN